MKRVCYLLIMSLLLTTLLAIPAVAASDLEISVGDKQIEYKYGQPVIINERSMVPLRDLLLNLGVADDSEHIQWNGVNKTVTVKLGDITLLLSLDSKEILRNGKLFQTLDSPATLIDNRLYLPARAVAEALGYKVAYNEVTNNIAILQPTPSSQLPTPISHSNDTIAPKVTVAQATSMSQVEVVFSEQMDITTSNIATYYRILSRDGDMVEITKADLQADQTKVILTTGPLYGGNHTLEIYGITDLNGNPIVTEPVIFAGIGRPIPVIEEIKVIDVKALTSESIQVTFDHNLDKLSAETKINYRTQEIDGMFKQLTIIKAELLSDTTKVILTTSKQKPGTLYTLSVSKIVNVDVNVTSIYYQYSFRGFGVNTYVPPGLIPDGETGEILGIETTSSTTFEVIFNFELDQASAENIANYAVQEVYGHKQPMALSKAELQSDKSKVIVTIAPMSLATIYKLTASNLQDTSGQISTLEATTFYLRP